MSDAFFSCCDPVVAKCFGFFGFFGFGRHMCMCTILEIHHPYLQASLVKYIKTAPDKVSCGRGAGGDEAAHNRIAPIPAHPGSINDNHNYKHDHNYKHHLNHNHNHNHKHNHNHNRNHNHTSSARQRQRSRSRSGRMSERVSCGWRTTMGTRDRCSVRDSSVLGAQHRWSRAVPNAGSTGRMWQRPEQ